MADGKRVLLYILVEFLGSAMLGMIQAILRTTTERSLGYLFFPFFVWAAYAVCYRASGGHLNPILSIASLLRLDKHENYSYAAVILYIPAQFAGFFVGVLCQWWFDQFANQLRFAQKCDGDY